MCSFHSFIEELYNNTKIPFNIELDGESEIVLTSIENVENDILYIPIDIGHKKGRVITHKTYESCTDLLKYCIESKLKDIFMSKEEVLINILNGQDVSKDSIRNNIPILLDSFYLINICVDGYQKEALEIIRAVYNEDEVISIEHNNQIIMIGALDDIEEHVISLKESISSDTYSKCYISYCEVSNVDKLKSCFEEGIFKIKLAIKYDLPERIYGERSLLFETIVDSVGEKVKDNIFEDFNDGFSKLDVEMTKTIEAFFKCGLNISDASKELYVHRNTLIYRLDKIEKFTSYDIRNFNQAVIFKIAFLIWKEKQNN